MSEGISRSPENNKDDGVMNRRDFLRLSTLAAAGTALRGASPKTPAREVPEPEQESSRQNEVTTISPDLESDIESGEVVKRPELQRFEAGSWEELAEIVPEGVHLVAEIWDPDKDPRTGKPTTVLFSVFHLGDSSRASQNLASRFFTESYSDSDNAISQIIENKVKPRAEKLDEEMRRYIEDPGGDEVHQVHFRIHDPRLLNDRGEWENVARPENEPERPETPHFEDRDQRYDGTIWDSRVSRET